MYVCHMAVGSAGEGGTGGSHVGRMRGVTAHDGNHHNSTGAPPDRGRFLYQYASPFTNQSTNVAIQMVIPEWNPLGRSNNRNILWSYTGCSSPVSSRWYNAGGASGKVRAIHNNGAMTVDDPVPSPTAAT